ncbi:MAG: DNA polymerase I [Arenicellales bacterium]
MPTNTRLILVDGSSFLFRAYHAMPDLQTRSGQMTGAIYGVTNMLRKLVKECDPELIAIVYDAKGKNFRHAMYDQYKANRPPAPEELVSQIKYVHEITEAMGLPLLCIPEVEADDVIGTLSAQASEKGMDVLIVTGDKDMAQLVNKHVSLIDTMKNHSMDEQGVMDKFGVRPDQIIDYLALMGDTSDNIPGVPKVGPKTASKWLAAYETIDNLVEHADEIGGKVGESLREHIDQLWLSRDLTTIRLDVPLDLPCDELHHTEPDIEALARLYKTLDFNTWARELATASPHISEDINIDYAPDEFDTAETTMEAVETDYVTILDEDTLNEWLDDLSQAKVFAVDTETTSIDAQQAQLVGVSFCMEAGKAAYLPLKHSYAGVPDQLPYDATMAKLKALLENPAILKVGQNLKYDAIVLQHHGIDLQGIKYDTMLESYLTEAGITRHDMDTLAMRHLDHKTIAFKDIAGVGKKQLTFDQIELSQAGPYAAEDADITLRLHHALMPKIEAIPSLKKLFADIEMPLLPVLARTESNGVLLDANLLGQQSMELGAKLDVIEKACHKAADEVFNIASPKQIQAILYDKLGLPVLKKTPKGQPSTAESVLQDLALEGHTLPQLILEHRSLAKLKSTYTDKLPKLINPRTGRVHTSYHQAVAATGRLSSSDPNLQNIPIRTEEGRRIREAFIASPGHKLLAADYSQIELRLMAHLSEDPRLVQAFKEGQDVHSATAAEVFEVDELENVTTDQRRSAKAINFGLIYGMSAFGLARQLRIGRDEASAYISTYFNRYPGVKKYMDEMRKIAADQGYVETLHGRRLYLPEINSKNFNRRQYAERTAINAPMQGSAADLIKIAMINVDKWIHKDAPNVRMILQVHDELVLEVPEAELDHTEQKVIELMTGVADLIIPLEVDTGTGDNWKQAH